MTKVMLSSAVLAASFLLAAGPAWAQTDGECGTGFCGTPKNNGGGGGGGGGGSILVNNTDIGITYSTSDDYDGDGREDDFDNCPFRPNADQADSDGDGVGDACDNCKAGANKDQMDTDADATGDVCDPDVDNDGKANELDNCPMVPNKAQTDTDGDGLGDACDPDIDGDGLLNRDDPCPFKAGQAICDDDTDGDGIPDAVDNCPLAANPKQVDTNKNGIGDNCDSDADGDGVVNGMDNCPLKPNTEQADDDHDGMGDACDVDGFCLLVPKNPDRTQCLDPNTMLKVVGAPLVKVNAGDTILLSLYVNRQNINLKYKWNVTAAPAGAKDTVKNPMGTANCGDGYECVPQNADKRPTFVPSRAGEYTLTLSADLPEGEKDLIEPTVMHAESNLVVTVGGSDVSIVSTDTATGTGTGTGVGTGTGTGSGDGGGGGCRFSPGQSPSGMTLAGLALLALLLRRRR